MVKSPLFFITVSIMILLYANCEADHMPSKPTCKDMKQWEIPADNGNLIAQANLGICYYYGYKDGKTIISHDYAKARKWLEKAIDHKLNNTADTKLLMAQAVAQDILGRMYEKGQGVSRNKATAKAMFKQSAEKDCVAGMIDLGRAYEYGFGSLLTEPEKAIEWYQKASDMGSAKAKYRLGNFYDHPQRRDMLNKKKAREWYELAANDGHLNAQFRVGMMYKDGVGVRQNYQKALHWLGRAAEKKHLDAQYYLGMMYYEGEGISKDLAKAKELFGQACDGGYEKGCTKFAEINKK